MNDYFSTERPEAVYEARQMTVSAKEVRKGDLVLIGTGAFEVLSRELKTKYAWLDLAGKNGLTKYDPDAGVLVERKVQTDESREAERAWYKNEMARKVFMKIGDKHMEARKALADRVAEGNMVMASDMETLLHWQYLESQVYGYRKSGEEGKASWTELYEDLVGRFTKDLVEGGASYWSGGFSVANAERQIAGEAQRWFVAELKYH